LLYWYRLLPVPGPTVTGSGKYGDELLVDKFILDAGDNWNDRRGAEATWYIDSNGDTYR
jgi:hypothetical protein